VPLATASEAQRMLAKSAARRWGGDGITVNVVTARVGGGGDAARTVPARDPGDGVAAAVVWLASAAAAAITGATIGADGGGVMAP
jgi:3-oxoacyl-[acyl-carrier protein] reductase